MTDFHQHPVALVLDRREVLIARAKKTLESLQLVGNNSFFIPAEEIREPGAPDDGEWGSTEIGRLIHKRAMSLKIKVKIKKTRKPREGLRVTRVS